jgi:hypothetical protein
MIKNVIILILLIVTAWLTYLEYGDTINTYIRTIQKNEPVLKTEPTKNDQEICAQVITSARDPKTGDIREFPTPCDVPKTWEVIQNDIPGMGDLQ